VNPLPDGGKILMICVHLDTIPQRDGQMDGRTSGEKNIALCMHSMLMRDNKPFIFYKSDSMCSTSIGIGICHCGIFSALMTDRYLLSVVDVVLSRAYTMFDSIVHYIHRHPWHSR